MSQAAWDHIRARADDPTRIRAAKELLEGTGYIVTWNPAVTADLHLTCPNCSTRNNPVTVPMGKWTDVQCSSCGKVVQARVGEQP